MARMIAEVYDALRSAGAEEDKARAAATAVAGQLELDGRLDRLESRFDRLETRFDRLETRLGKLETDVAVLKWMVGANIALTILVLGKLLLP
jgi:chromosome segregation ATPase